MNTQLHYEMPLNDWIDYFPGVNKPPEDTSVIIQLRDGYVNSNVRPASYFDWKRTLGSSCIEKYKVIRV
jgi:hypothetical protein